MSGNQGTRIIRQIGLNVLLLLLFSKNYAQFMPSQGMDRLSSLQRKRAQWDSSTLQQVAFRNIGPAIMGGRVVDLEVNPEKPAEFYIAYATGGLWHSTNNGQSLEPIFDKEATIVIGDIAVNWKTRDIWIGTGEVNSSRSSYAGLGVYRSRDNGKTWNHSGLPESHHIGKIMLHPSDTNTVWVAAMGALYTSSKDRGVFKTSDGGKTWRKTLFVNPATGAVDMEIDPYKPNILYAAAWERSRKASNFTEGGLSSGIYKSIDGGESWKLISMPGTGFPQGEGIGRIGLAISKSNPAFIYAVVDNYNKRPDTASADTSRIHLYQLKDISKDAFLSLSDAKLDRFLTSNGLKTAYSAAALKEKIKSDELSPNALYRYLHQEDGAPTANQIHGAEVYRSEDGGSSWRKTHDKPLSIYNTYGYYFGKIYVSPANAEKIIILGFSADLSLDGGKTFKTMDKSNTHADWHACWINPADDSHIIAGNDGGANITYDNGFHWFKINTPSVGQFYAITTDQEKPYNVYGGMQDNGSWYGPSNHKEGIDWLEKGQYPFKPLNGGDGMQAQVDPRDNKTIYSGLQFGSYFRFSKGSSEMKPVRPAPSPLQEEKLRFNWQTPILISPHNADIIYMGSQKLHRSLAKGERFESISGDLTGGNKPGDVPFGTLTCISESPLSFGLIYTGSDDGRIHVTKDGGNTWARIDAPDKKGKGGLPQGLWLSRVVASKHIRSRVYATLNGYRLDHFNAYVFVSDDYGQTWKRLGKDLPLEPVNVIREDPVSAGIIYVGTDGGAYASIDGGEHFMPFVHGLPFAVPVHDIAIQERENEIILGTHGRSIYIAKLDGFRKSISSINPTNH